MVTIVLIVQMLLEIAIMILAEVAILFIVFFVVEEKVKPYYRNWKIKKNIQQFKKDKEKEKYPLFFWRESCAKRP